MQKKTENIIICTDQIKAFQRTLRIWKRITIEGNLEMFPLVSNACINEALPIIVEHLISLEEKLSSYIPALNPDQYDWISNPFYYNFQHHIYIP